MDSFLMGCIARHRVVGETGFAWTLGSERHKKTFTTITLGAWGMEGRPFIFTFERKRTADPTTLVTFSQGLRGTQVAG